MILAWLPLTLLACQGLSQVPGGTECDVRALERGQVRVRQVPCEAELLSDGEGRRYDDLLENAFVRYFFREPQRSLTLLEPGGGTLVDAAEVGGADTVSEAVPLLGDCALADIQRTLVQGADVAEIHLSGTLVPVTFLGSSCSASTAEVTWRLRADDPVLELEGADGLWVVPLSGQVLTGSLIRTGDQALGYDGDPEDWGGAIRFHGGGRLAVGATSVVQGSLWPGGPFVFGEARAEAVEALAGDQVVGWLPVEGWGEEPGTFQGLLPEGTETVRAVASGFADGPEVAAAPGLSLEVGDPGYLAVRVADGEGQDRAALVQVGQVDLAVPPGGLTVALGPGQWDVTATGGPTSQRVVVPEVEIRGVVTLDLVLPRAFTPDGYVLARLDAQAWPSRETRLAPSVVTALESARGASFVVTTASDEIAEASIVAPWNHLTRVESGSRAQADGWGPVLTWPWTSNAKKSAHGAAPWQGLDAVDGLQVARGSGGSERFSVIGTAWVQAASTPDGWDPAPDALFLQDPTEVPTYLDLLDRWQTLAAVGPWTWVATEDPASFAVAEVEKGIVDGTTLATTGPLALLEVDGGRPGSVLPPTGTHQVTLQVLAPAWMDLVRAEVVADGATAAGFDLVGTDSLRLDVALEVQAERYVLALAWGLEDAGTGGEGVPWVVTSPVWVGSPTPADDVP